MNKLNVRQFGRDLTLSGSTYTSTKGFSMPGLILDGQNVDTTLEEFDTAIDGHTSAIDDAVAAIANNTSAINNNTTSIESLPASGSYIYVDASAGAGDGSGTFIDPYRSLKNAMDEEVTDAETDDMVFHVAPGIYDGTFSLTKTTANQSVSIIGSGSENTIIRGAATWSNSTSHAFYFKNFKSIFISNITVSLCQYGVYARSCEDVVLHNVHFKMCGSDGDVNMFKFSNSQATQASYWAGNQTSDGGAMRLRSCDHVEVQNCRAELCLRGLRIQDIGTDQRTSMISNNMTYKTVESGIYLAANSYTQNSADGCTNVVVTGNHVYNAYNNGILCIGGRQNAIVGNVVQSTANAGINITHVVNTRVCNNTIDSAELVSHNGIGNNGDIGGQIAVVGGGNSTTDTGYIATVSGNTMVQSSGVNDCGIYIGADPYPAAINKVFISGNVTDATTSQLVDNAITVVTQDGGGGGGFNGDPDRVMQTDGSGDAETSSVTATTLGFLDATSSIQTQINERAKLTEGNFTGGLLQIQGNDDTSVYITRSGQTTFTLQAKNGYARIRYSGCKFMFWTGGRYKMEGTHLQIPMNGSAPGDNAANCQGGLWVDTSGADHVLKFHDGTTWKSVTLS